MGSGSHKVEEFHVFLVNSKAPSAAPERLAILRRRTGEFYFGGITLLETNHKQFLYSISPL